MKRYTYIIAAVLLTILSSCIKEEFTLPEENPSAGKGIQIIGAAEDFDEKNVATRASGDVSDSHITEMTMFIFKDDGNMIQGYDASQNPISSAVNIQKPNPTFLIETSRYDGTGIIASMDGDQSQFKYYNNKDTDLDGCKIYIVANAYAQLTEKGLLDGNTKNGEITSLETLQAALLDVDETLDMPKNADGEYIGFPMIGTHSEGTTFNLGYNSGQSNSGIATIPLKKLYSKVRFRMQVNSKQIVDGGQVPQFTIDKAEVYNVPTKVRMGYAAGDYTSVIGNNSITDSNLGDYYHFTGFTDNEPFEITDFTKRTINHSSSATTNDYLEFGFYMPEHMLTPNTITYPANITDDAKQYYKPTGVNAVNNGDGTTTNAKIAPFVRIYGSYTDHNGQIKKVEYDIYLGQNNSDNFEVKRNQQLNNYLTITGLTNHKDAYPDAAGNISIDHRVNVEDKGFNLSMEREAILDAHFEVRPIDIEVQAGSSVTVVIPEDVRSWIAMESDAAARSGVNSSLYVNTTDARKGVRKYFTTNLVSELTAANGGTVTVRHSGTTTNTEYHRIWFYVDENPNVYDKSGTGKQDTESGDHTVGTTQYRLGKVQFYYAASGAPDTTGDPAATINFQQWNLWRVWNSDGNRYYDIEHEEEYLNNYASDQGYGATQNGMAWGLDGIALSNKVRTIRIEQSSGVVGFLEQIGWDLNKLYTNLIENLPDAPRYDFYLSRDGWVIDSSLGEQEADYKRDYQGHTFNKEIATTLLTTYPTDEAAKLNYSLNELEKSAFAYCYNKNKRDANGNVCVVNEDGTVNTDNLKWYLPAIDEIEEIAKGAYDEFDRVFQNEKYWSCQPATDKNRLQMPVRALITWGTCYADYYADDIDRARATSVYTADGGVSYQNIDSGLPKDEDGEQVYSGLQAATMNLFTPSFGTYTPYTLDFSSTPGNLSRSSSCRVRAVYRSGTGTKAQQRLLMTQQEFHRTEKERLSYLELTRL